MNIKREIPTIQRLKSMIALGLMQRMKNMLLSQWRANMVTGKPMYYSLTGENSHEVMIPAGQGSFSIGTTGLSSGKYDVWVDRDLPIFWNTFDDLTVPAGYPWPRWFYYSGNDTGFVDWASKRPIEGFSWWPQESTSIDLSNAKISTFSIHTENSKIAVSTGDKIRQFDLSGNLENIDIKKCTQVPRLNFSPLCEKAETRLYQLPVYRPFEKATSIQVEVSPIGQAFDCISLLQFPNLSELRLNGNLANLEVLAELKHLEKIWLWFVPDLSDMPKIATWKKLKSFVALNIEETAGKALRVELKELMKTKQLEDFSTVSRLRKTIWFTTEYGIPFSDWEGKNAKIATSAYKACLKEIKKSKTEDEVQKAIVAFVEVINGLPDIETVEREDAHTAVNQLVESSALGISQETGSRWFDEFRDF